MATRQSAPRKAATSTMPGDGPSPSLRLNGRKYYTVPSTLSTKREPPMIPAEVRVKNTFLHVDEEESAKPLQKSMSDGALTTAPSPTVGHGHKLIPPQMKEEDVNPTPGASSSTLSPARGEPEPRTFKPRVAEASHSIDDEDEDEEDQGKDGQWSVGSLKHDARACTPCAYYGKNGCTKGRSCKFCHMPHQRKARVRPCKAKRNQCKQIVAMLDNMYTGNQEQVADDLRRMCSESGASAVDTSYLLSIVNCRARMQEGASSSAP